MRLSGNYILGAMAAPRGKAPFDRASVVLGADAERGPFLQVRAYIGAGDVDGKAISSEEWEALVRSEQAIRLEGVAAVTGAALWVLRPSFTGREGALEELRASGALLHDKFVGSDGSFLCLLREPDAAGFRDDWAARASADARLWARSGAWERVLEAATRAFTLERALHPERLALLALTHERCGNTERAKGYVAMAERSRGKDFAAQVREQFDALRREFGAVLEAPPESGVRPKYAKDFAEGSLKGVKASMRRFGRAA